MNEQETYEFHQTPVALAQALIPLVPLEPNDTLYEAFRGQGAFYNNFPEGHKKDWSEITEGRDYKDYTGEYDWIITNPPFKLDGKSAIWTMIDYYTQRAKKGIAFLVNDYGFSTITPIRQAFLKERGWGLTKITMVNVKKWRGRYFFMIFEKGKPSVMDYLLGSF